MRTYTRVDLEDYLRDDWIKYLIEQNVEEPEKKIRTNQWLTEMDNKRLIYADVYGDILCEKTSKKVLDVGGGYNALTKVLAANSSYTLLDFLAHGGSEYLVKTALQNHINWLREDWYELAEIEDYDVIIANDIFPDVDQRMELFIEKMLPHCHELRLTVTYYNKPCFYTTKRMDDSEIMTFLSWDGEITAMKLKKYESRCNVYKGEINTMINFTDSIYRNGRHVSYIIIRGDL